MTKTRRYEAHYDGLNDLRIAQSVAQNQPCTLGQNAYGPTPLHWERGRQPEVWVWISWRAGPATRIPAVAAGWNDRVVIVEWEAPGGRRSVVVWRNAVTQKQRRGRSFRSAPSVRSSVVVVTAAEDQHQPLRDRS